MLIVRHRSALDRLLDEHGTRPAVRMAAAPWLAFVNSHRVLVLEFERVGEFVQAAKEKEEAATIEGRAIEHLRAVVAREYIEASE